MTLYLLKHDETGFALIESACKPIGQFPGTFESPTNGRPDCGKSVDSYCCEAFVRHTVAHICF